MVILAMAGDYYYVCPRCGAPTKYNRERGGLCIDCYVKMRGEGISENIKVRMTICIGCGRIRYGKEWYPLSTDTLGSILMKLLKKTDLRKYDVSIQQIPLESPSTIMEYKKILVPILIEVTKGRSVTRYVQVGIEKTLCPLCSRKQSGKYYESIIRLRFKSEIAETLREDINRFIDVSLRNLDRIETVDIKKDGPHGLVTRWSNRRIARKFLEFLKSRYSILIIRKYREPITIVTDKGTTRHVMVDNYMVRLIHGRI